VPVLSTTSWIGEAWPYAVASISTDWFAAPVEMAPESVTALP
jgi:hypothetical protein